MEFIFRIIIRTNNFPPLEFRIDGSQIEIEDCYNLLLTNKKIRKVIEDHNRTLCSHFNNYHTNIKIKLRKYKTYFNCLILWNYKLPKEVIRNIDFNSSTFIPICEVFQVVFLNI